MLFLPLLATLPSLLPIPPPPPPAPFAHFLKLLILISHKRWPLHNVYQHVFFLNELRTTIRTENVSLADQFMIFRCKPRDSHTRLYSKHMHRYHHPHQLNTCEIIRWYIRPKNNWPRTREIPQLRNKLGWAEKCDMVGWRDLSVGLKSLKFEKRVYLIIWFKT